MLKAPNFWYNRNTTFFSIILYPASILFRILTKIYVIICKTKTADIPVICIGNLVVGGAGKTPVALKMGEILKLSGYNPHRASPNSRTIPKYLQNLRKFWL